jgi:alkaline phosphatase
VARIFLSIALVALIAGCSSGTTKPPPDAGRDAGTMPRDAEAGDAPANDADPPDAGEVIDSGVSDSGDSDAAFDAGNVPDTGGGDTGPRPIVILMIGDGMGAGQREAASIYAHGAPGRLFMESLPHRGELETGSLSGITDSAAAATAMATGVQTYNRALGIDRDGNPVETILERAQREGYGAGVVSTASLPHATPAAFSAHVSERFQYVEIANDQARNVRPFVALGGGALFYNPAGAGSQRTDDGLIAPLVQAGWQYVSSSAELAAASPANGQKLLGIFAPEHLDYVVDRQQNTTQPTLTEMTLSALTFLDSYDKGFFLMIEGAKIDMASHANDPLRAITETLAFDDAVRTVSTWAMGREDVTLIVSADHECGGLTVTQSNGAGTVPDISWRWGLHTNTRIGIFGSGPGSELLGSEIHTHTWVNALMKSKLFREPLAAPAPIIIPDGRLTDLRHRAATQAAPTAFGAGFNQLDALLLDADQYGLAIGIEGLVEWDKNALIILLDIDYGASTGPARIFGAFTDRNGRVDSILSSLKLEDPDITGFGADFALVSWGGADPRIDELSTDAGLRGLRAPFGRTDDLGWYSAAINFGEGVRTRAATMPLANEGFEGFIPWATLYPDFGGRVPANATIAIAAILVNDAGTYLSNQALPPFDASVTTNPGSALTKPPGLAVFVVDADGDGIADGNAAPSVVLTP